MLPLTRQEKTLIIFLISLFLAGSLTIYLKHKLGVDISSQKAVFPKETTVNINTADEKALEDLPGVGPVLSRRIVDYRISSGMFKSIEEIKKVKGMGKAKFDAIKDRIKVE